MANESIEHCVLCNSPTGKAGATEDSLYLSDGTGPVCESCFDEEEAPDGK